MLSTVQLSPNLLALKCKLPNKEIKDPASARARDDEADVSVGAEEFVGLAGLS